MASKDKLGMSLDDIIQLDRKKKANVSSRGAQGRGGHNIRGRGRISPRGRGGSAIRGRGGSIIRGRGGMNSRGRGGANIRGRGGINSRPGGRNIGGRGRSNNLDRGGIKNRGRISINARGGRNQGVNRRGQKRPQRILRGSQGMTNSFRSDHIIRQQVLQQKMNRVRSLKQTMSKNSVSGASDMLTVCITNDLAMKRRRRSKSVPRSGSVNSFGRDSFVRRGNNNMYLNRQSLDRLNASTVNSNLAMSPEGSIVTTVSRPSRASSVGRNRNQRSSSVGRDRFQSQNQGQAIVEQYLPASNWQTRSGLNMQLQKEIAAIQGKPFIPPTGFANGSTSGLCLSDFRPVPTLTGTTLNERFS
ncbi:hypothetical protein L9F63_019913 [Diploptera punctata]|uniref:Uncharacterized protein n=1 Tax=Diploptera punctata TaxID=6984 RepID=A0AAD7ZTA2_DIPPU|nr:hypothetical protein L9F63_019913 [Diploptera punctata]